VKAFVILAPGHAGSEDLVRELEDHCKRVSAPYKYPREIEFVAELPKTIFGKIRHVELREREVAAGTRKRLISWYQALRWLP
jgi:acyl-coenzyme A synthetase/AMP-(fatty) acid ligase